MKLAGLAAVLLLFASEALGQEHSSIGRFQLMQQAPITVIDTVTGELWTISGDTAVGYTMRRVCYVGPDGHLMPTPHESDLTADLSRAQALCARLR